MSGDRRTKTQLLDHLSDLERRHALNMAALEKTVKTAELLETELAEANKKPTTSQKEALALGGCISWLDSLTVSTSNYNSNSIPDATAIGRVLKHLAAKFGVALIEYEVRDCNRAHVDQINQYALQQSIQSLLGTVTS